jgi:hypothetical protein
MNMTRAERDQLLSLVKKRERVMRTKAQERSAELLADFDAQSAKVYHWDEDATWARAKEEAVRAIEKANAEIAAQCEALGIPAEFAPGVQMFWHGRGQNEVGSRRVELRRAAKSRIEAIEAKALAHIGEMSLQAQTEIVAHGLESEAAKAFLGAMPALDQLMPSLKMDDVAQLMETKRKQRQIGYLQ